MPYKSEKIKLSREQDRRIKLTETQREEIKKEYSTGLIGQRPLAKKYGVSRGLIQIIVNDEIAEKKKQYSKDSWKKYQLSKEERNKVSREYRRYKQNLYNKGELK